MKKPLSYLTNILIYIIISSSQIRRVIEEKEGEEEMKKAKKEVQQEVKKLLPILAKVFLGTCSAEETLHLMASAVVIAKYTTICRYAFEKLVKKEREYSVPLPNKLLRKVDKTCTELERFFVSQAMRHGESILEELICKSVVDGNDSLFELVVRIHSWTTEMIFKNPQ